MGQKLRKVTIDGLHCYRCGYNWKPRPGTKKVRTCPECKSPYWDKPKREKKEVIKMTGGCDRCGKPMYRGRRRKNNG